jgi:hypothetical protein
LERAYPKLRTFIELIKLNGHIFEHVYGQRCSDESVLNLESIIGRVCEAIGKPLRNAPEREDTEYDVLVKIHMFWYDGFLDVPSYNLLNQTQVQIDSSGAFNKFMRSLGVLIEHLR